MTSKEKKLTIIRILIFLALAFVPVYIITIFGSDENANVKTTFGALSIMWYPAIANVITRAITKEGFEESYLRINLKGNVKYYVFAIVAPIILTIVGSFTEVLRFSDGYSLSRGVKEMGGGGTTVAIILSLFVGSIYQLDRGFGEEFGWRAYLTPKLEKLMPSTLAMTVSGIIWGLWHAPLIAKGYNFGKEISPALAVIMMCVSCTVMSFILSWLTKRTNSVYPAAIYHIVLDVFNAVIFSLICLGIKEYDGAANQFRSSMMFMIVIPLAIAVPAAISMIRSNRAEAD